MTPVYNPSEISDCDELIAHTISTKSVSPVVTDEDMAVPSAWKTDPTATYDVGHQPEGRTITLHSLAVAPNLQKSGYGKTLMAYYIDHMKQTAQAERISILTYDRLVSYYEKLGFTHYGKSQSEYAGVAWHDLVWSYRWQSHKLLTDILPLRPTNSILSDLSLQDIPNDLELLDLYVQIMFWQLISGISIYVISYVEIDVGLHQTSRNSPVYS